TVRAVAPTAGEAVVIAGAGGGVGVFAVQLAVRTGTCVIALASERHHSWLRERGAVPVAYGDGVRERIMVAAEETPVVAFIDLVGRGYVELVRDHNPRLVAVALDELAQEALGGMLITSRLNQDVQHDAVLVDRPPQPVARTTDTNSYFVEMPFVAGSSSTTTKLM